MQPELWKTLAAMAPVISQRPLKVQRYIVQPAYILPMPLLAKNQSNLEVSKGDTVYNVLCVNCCISNCVDGNDYNNYKAVMLIKQPPYLMVPVKLKGQ